MTQEKLACPRCGTFKSTVIKSRPARDLLSYARQRRCQRCGLQFDTSETIVLIDKVHKPAPRGHI